jgi:hypothetical protein
MDTGACQIEQASPVEMTAPYEESRPTTLGRINS